MVEHIFATDDEETTPGMPQEGGEDGQGDEEMPAQEPVSLLDGDNGEEEEKDGDSE